MSRRLLGLALLLSVGVNVGILAMVFLRTAPSPAGAPAPPPPETALSEPDRLTPDEPVESNQPAPAIPPAEHPEPPREPPPERPRTPPSEPVTPDQRPSPERPMPALQLERLADELGLEGEVRDQFNRIQRDFLGQAWQLRNTVRTSEAVIRQQLFARQPDRRRLAASQQRIEHARQELETLFVDTVLRSRTLLDPDQERRYLRVIGRLRQVATSGQTRNGGLRATPLEDDPRPLRRRGRNGRFPRRPPG